LQWWFAMIELPVAADTAALVKACNAAVVYVARQRRAIHPQGEFELGGRWYPYMEMEYRGCCDRIRCPSRNWPYSLMLHCRTAKHVAALFSVPEKDVRRAAKMFTNVRKRKLAVEAEKALRYAGNDAESDLVA
jgi:hypothetical protein